MKGNKNTSVHIGIYGKRNAGKSSLINALTGQETAIVSDIPGTTTDPVKKSLEIFGIGACILIDTAGIDDLATIGELRIQKTIKTLDEIDIAILIFSENNFDNFENDLIHQFNNKKIPFIIVSNKTDIVPLENALKNQIQNKHNKSVIEFACNNPNNISEITNQLVECYKSLNFKKKSLFGDIIEKGSIVLLVTPIDSEAPEGRMILPQVQAIRDILDNESTAIILKENEIEHFLLRTNIRPDLVVTDSQMFKEVDKLIPQDIPLTGFSVVLAYNKGDFDAYIEGTPKLSQLIDNDRVLLLESCTHQVSCEDIGRFKIPRWIDQFTGKKIEYDIVTGLDKLSRPIEDYALVIQCGGCVVTRKQLLNRLQKAKDCNIAVTNYGMAIAYLNGIFDRAIAPFLKMKKNV